MLALLAVGCGGGGGDAGTDAAAPETATGAGAETESGGGTVEAPVETDNDEAATETGTGEVECSATESGLALDEQELPAPVAEMRERLFSAAAQCDYEELAEIANASEGFTFSFGDPGGSPADYWRTQEQEATGEPMYSLQMVLSLPFTKNESGSYVWPSAHSENATDADWQALIDEGFYFQSDIDAMREGGTGYTGWRTAITPKGQWLYFTEGD